MRSTTGTLKIGALAAQAGVGIDTVRFYERAGLLPPAGRTAAGYRMYGPEDVRRLQFVRRAKALGFTLEQVAELLQLQAGKGGRAGVKALADRRLSDLERKIRELAAMREALARYAQRCSGQGAVEGCPIVEALMASPTQEQPSCHSPMPHIPSSPRTTPAARSRRRDRN